VLFAEPPRTWPNAPHTSILHTLLLFGGVPLLITAVIVLAVMAPSLARGPRYSPGHRSNTKSEWFGDAEPPPPLEAAPDQPPQLTGSTRAPAADDTGGASVRW
jgi:hypothetical protein